MLLSMDTQRYRSELEEAREKLQDLLVKADELQVRIAKQKRVIAALQELTNDDEGSEAIAGLVKGITDACKTAIWGAGVPLSPVEVREKIKALGVPEQKNLLASVHTILKRLDDAGEIRALPDGTYRRMTLGDRIARSGMPVQRLGTHRLSGKKD
jgi:hypothetical protein